MIIARGKGSDVKKNEWYYIGGFAASTIYDIVTLLKIIPHMRFSICLCLKMVDW